MPHPQDIAVPSLPEPELPPLPATQLRFQVELTPTGERLDYTADQMNTRWLEGYEAGRAAGRASAEPEVGKSLSAAVADSLRPYLSEGERVIWQEPFRWKDDNGVMPNHFESMSLDALAADFGYTVVHDCGCAGIIRAAAPTPTASIAPKAEADWCDADDSAVAEALRKLLRREPTLAEVTAIQKACAAPKAGASEHERGYNAAVRDCAALGWKSPKAEGEAVDMPEDDEAHNAWVSAREVDGIQYSGAAFERGWELALSNGLPEWPTWANQILKVVREHSGYDGYDDQDGVDLVEETSECLRELAAMADRARSELAALTKPPRDVAPVAQAAAGASEDVALWQLVYGAIMGTDRRPVSIADFYAAAKRVADMIERRAALSPRPSADADRASGGGV